MNGVSIYMEPETETDPFLVFGKPDIGQREIEAVVNVLRSGWLSTGKVVEEFERQFKKMVGGYPVAVASCSQGIVLSLLSMDLYTDEDASVITTPLTFAATANSIISAGLNPSFVDVDESGQIDSDQIEEAIREDTRAILPVHYTGSSPKMEKILAIARKHNLPVIEDAAHGFGGTYKGKPQGTFGDFGCFSFYPTKNITCGEGGMVVCKTQEMADMVRNLAMQGLTSGAYRRYGSGPIRSYQVERPGIKANLSDIHAAIGLVQLQRWPELREKRAEIWEVYEDAFGRKERGHSQHLFTILHKDRDGLRKHLHNRGIGTGIHFNPLHLEPAFDFGHMKGQFPNAEKIGAETLSLPVSTTMTVEDARRVVREVKNFGGGK